MTTDTHPQPLANGGAAAALVSVGIGVFAYGLLVVLALASGGMAELLNWYPPAGPLSGKTGAAIVIWLGAWLVLKRRWRDADVDLGRAWRWTLGLLAVGFLATFPPFFELFG